MEISITLNTNEVQKVIQEYLINQGVNAEVTSTKCDYTGVNCKATLNPQPTAAPRQCVEPEPKRAGLPPVEPFVSINVPDFLKTVGSDAAEKIELTEINWDGLPHNNYLPGIHADAAGRIMSEDEIRELHK